MQIYVTIECEIWGIDAKYIWVAKSMHNKCKFNKSMSCRGWSMVSNKSF